MLCLPSTLRKVRDCETLKMTTGFDIQHIYKKYKILENITKTKTPLINVNSLSRRSTTRKYDINKGNSLNNSFKHQDKLNSERKGVFTYKSDTNVLSKKAISKSESERNMLCKTKYNLIPFKIKPLDYNLSSSINKNNLNLSNSTNNKNIHLKSLSLRKRKNKSSINNYTSDLLPPHVKQFYLKKTNQKSSFTLLKTDFTLNNNNCYNTYIRNNRIKNQNITIIKPKDKLNINKFTHNFALHKANINVLMQYGYKTQAGQKENKIQKTNQDYILIKTNINNISDFNVFAVLDGHGENGRLASSNVGEFIYHKITEMQLINKLTNQKEIYNKLKNNNYEIIKNAFESAETELKTKEINYNESGTTCCLVIQIGNNIICANTGDSRSILIKSFKNKNSNTCYKHIALSNDHKPIIDEERKRIEMNGGKVEQWIQNGQLCGTYRVWAKDGTYPGLAVSRTIGDLNASCLGVIPEPEVKECIVDDNCKYIIIASDGLWDVLDNKTVVELSKEYYEEGDPDKLCEKLVNEATKVWENGEGTVDDITVVTAFFGNGK